MTCSVVFHFKIKKTILQSRFLGDSHLIFLTENSLLLFSFETSSFVDELKLWDNEKTARYIRDYNLNDFDIWSHDGVHWVCLGNEVGQVVVWKLQMGSSGQIKKDFQIFEIYSSTRTKRVKWGVLGDQSFLVTVSTGGDISVFDFSPETRIEFANDLTSPKLLAAVAEKKMEVRITQLGVCTLTPEADRVRPETTPKTVKKDVVNKSKKNMKNMKPKKIIKAKKNTKKAIVSKVKTKRIKKKPKAKKPNRQRPIKKFKARPGLKSN